MTTHYDIITDDQILALREGADRAHDREQVALCDLALGYGCEDDTLRMGDGRYIIDMTRFEARAECALVLARAGK